MQTESAYFPQAIRYDNHAFNTKYCLCQMLRDKVECPLGKQVQTAKSTAEIRYHTSFDHRPKIVALLPRPTVHNSQLTFFFLQLRIFDVAHLHI